MAALQAGQRVDPAGLALPLRAVFPSAVQGFLIDLFGFDPPAEARRWTGPALVVQGDADLQVNPRDAALIAAAIPAARRVDLPGATHMLKAGVDGQPLATYLDPALPLHPDLIPAILQFLATVPGPGTPFPATS